MVYVWSEVQILTPLKTSCFREILFKVFLGLSKAYNALYWELFLEIIITYQAGMQTEHLLFRYLEVFAMVARAGCYDGAPFKVYSGFMQ